MGFASSNKAHKSNNYPLNVELKSEQDMYLFESLPHLSFAFQLVFSMQLLPFPRVWSLSHALLQATLNLSHGAPRIYVIFSWECYNVQMKDIINCKMYILIYWKSKPRHIAGGPSSNSRKEANRLQRGVFVTSSSSRNCVF